MMEAVEKSRLKTMNKSDNVSISSPPLTKKKHNNAAACPSSSSRLYRAPQSTIRRTDSDVGIDALEKTTSARRRRLQGGTSKRHVVSSLSSPAATAGSSRRGSTSKQRNKALSSRHHQLNSSDESSTNSVLEALEAPCLWMDDVEGNLTAVKFSSTSAHGMITRESKHRKRRNNRFDSADSVVSEQHTIGDEESVYTHYTTRSMCEVSTSYAAELDNADHHHSRHYTNNSGNNKGKLVWFCQRRWIRFWNSKNNSSSCKKPHVLLAQVAVVLAFVLVVWDSRRRVHNHKFQIQQYDEERAHILEQMTWIDNAAKKVHKKYAGYDSLDLLNTRQTNQHDVFLRDENKDLKAQVDLLQLRVQQNARDRTVRQFGDNPVQVSLPVTEGDVTGEHIIIALSDDTPHAVSTFLQQVGSGLWDQVDFQGLQNGRILQASTRFSSTTPVLEFVEKSRGCHQAGSVAVHQLESDDFQVMVLKIHMEETATIDFDDVCIGFVSKGLETLEQIIPQIPIIRSEEGEAPRPIGVEAAEHR